MSQPTVLIAEDNPGLAKVLSFKLQSSGLSTIMAADGLEAWNAYQEFRPDAVVSDYEMPGMSGVELCKKIRALEDGNQVPFVMVTGRQLELQQDGTVEHLDLQAIFSKPFSPAAVVETLRELLNANCSEE